MRLQNLFVMRSLLFPTRIQNLGTIDHFLRLQGKGASQRKCAGSFAITLQMEAHAIPLQIYCNAHANRKRLNEAHHGNGSRRGWPLDRGSAGASGRALLWRDAARGHCGRGSARAAGHSRTPRSRRSATVFRAMRSGHGFKIPRRALYSSHGSEPHHHRPRHLQRQAHDPAHAHNPANRAGILKRGRKP